MSTRGTPPKDAERLIAWIMGGLVVWGLFHAAGAWTFNHDARRPLVVLACTAAHLRVCGGQRVPVAAFFSEDFEPVLFFGDRTLSAYRAAARAQLGESCASGAVPPAADTLAAVTAEWLEHAGRPTTCGAAPPRRRA